MLKIIETERLYLRQFITEDASHFFAMNNDPEVIRYTGDPPFTNQDAAHKFITNYDAYAKYGLGRYAVIRKEDDTFLGWCGLKYHPDKRVVDIGYRFYKNYWNKGYATESARGCIQYAFNVLKYPSLVAHAAVNNKSSHNVLEKCGMDIVKEIDYDGQRVLLYKLENSLYDLKNITAEDTWPVRHPVLRAGRPLEDVYMEADEKESTFHLGIYFKDQIVGVASFMKDHNPIFKGVQSRLRGMAVLPEYRKRGLAAMLLKRGEEILRSKGQDVLWFNARIAAVNFYKEQGYTTFGSEFDIPKVGPHYVMKKQL
ncbi:GNAT family N-acetyltransferase [Dokdonia sinensis]|uniref:GNAT family N-acetyltransferase n=1 Tax=Dokdonia sinensis TaxID=2479847 RepID=A0A3M0FTH4_9FLAO|nr:GNAT family N-acetyltransferase [Dokdonia sinensis]RMB56100.1 GNAT family N-acetyltransferase [Dokdonia sinensis]